MEAKAIAKTVRIAPRKVRLVVDLIRGKSVAEAAAILRLTPKGSSVVVEKVLKSAAANALNLNSKLDEDMLYVKEIRIDEGPRLKRVWFRARGRADQLLKRMCHITVIVDEKAGE